MHDLKNVVIDFLFQRLTQEIILLHGEVWELKTGEGYQVLLEIMSRLPFEWIKKILESTSFSVPSDRERYKRIL